MVDDGAACVYVRAAVLAQLERDKHELRRQLASARQQVEVRAAAASASEARAADLLAILELNRNGADRALEQVRSAKDAQRREFARCVLRSLLRHLVVRRLRQAFAWWRSRSDHHIVDGRPAPVGGRNCCCEVRAPDSPPAECAFAFDECFRLRFARRRELCAIVFAAWKSLARQRSLEVASSRRRRVHRLLTACVSSWRLYLERRVRARAVMRGLIAKQTRRTLLKAWMTLRRACVNESATIWIQALDAARQAVDEEREQLMKERYEALKQAHDAITHDQIRRQRHSELYSHKLASLARDDVKQRYFFRWKLQVSQVVRTRTAVLRLVRSRYWKLRGFFNAWRCEANRSRSLRDASSAVRTRSSWRRLTLAFKSLAAHAAIVKRQRVTLRRLIHRFKTTRNLSHAWRRWRIHTALESQRLLASYDEQQLTDHFEIREAMHQHELRCAVKLRRQAQLACALHMRDRRRERRIRSVMTKWALVTRVQARRRRHLQRLFGHISDNVKRRAISQWHQRATVLSRRLTGISALARRHQTCRMREILLAWRSTFCHDRRVRFDRSVGMLRLQLSRLQSDRVWQRGVALYRLLYRKWLIDARRQAFISWKHRVDELTRRETLGLEQREASIAYVWTAWTRYYRHRLRMRTRQHQAICEKLKHREQTLTRKHVVFAAWFASVSRSMSQRRRIGQFIAAQRLARERLSTSFDQWRNWRQDRDQRRRLLVAKLCRRRLERVLQLYWHQWTRQTVISAVQETQKRAHCIASDDRRALMLRLLASRQRQRQLALRLVWSKWTARVKYRQRAEARNNQLTTFVERHQLLKLRRECFQRWRGDLMALNDRARHAMRVLLRQTSRRRMLRAFRGWQRLTRSLAVVRLLDDHTRAKTIAEERIASLAGARRESRMIQHAFAMWKSLVDRQRTRRRGCRCLTRRYTTMRTRIAWKHWLVLTRVSRHLHRLATLANLRARRVAWTRLVSLHSHFMKEQRRIRLLKFVAGTWRRWQLRSGWNRWRAQTVLARQARSQSHQLEAASSMMASMDKRWLHWASRWDHRSTQRRFLRSWRAYIARRQYTSTALHTARIKRLSLVTTAWKLWVKREKRITQTLLRLARSVSQRGLRRGMAQWRLQCHVSRLDGARREALIRILSSPSPSSIRSLNSYRPWLVANFAAWRLLYLRRRHQLRVLSVRRSTRLTRSTFHAWKRVVSTAKQIMQLAQKRQLRLLSSLFHQWKRQAHQRRQHLKNTLERLVLIMQRSLWRQGWKALRAHHGRETMRRQSALAFQSAQSVIEQHRKALAMRSAALMLARRQRVDATASFQRWKSFVVTRQQNHQLDRATNTRITRFRLRAAVAKWHLASHLAVRSRHNVHRWQKTSRRRQLQRCWCDWMGFVDDLRARKRAMTSTINTMLARSVGHRLKRAWSSWTALTLELRDRERQRRLDASNERVLLLVSDRSQLQEQHARELRQRSLGFFAVTLATVLMRSLQSNAEASKARAFDHWRHSILIVRHRAISNLVAVVTDHIRRSTLLRWRVFLRAQRTADEVKIHRQRTFERAAVLFASATTQTRKRRVMLTWQTFILARRTKRRQRALMVATISHGLDRATLRRCFRSWTRYVHASISRRHQLSKLSTIISGRALGWAFREWRRRVDAQVRLQQGAHLLARMWRRSDFKLLARRWRQWSHWLVLANAEVDQRDDRQGLLRRIFRAWVLHLAARSECLKLHERRRELRLLIVCFASWKGQCRRSGDLDTGSDRTHLQLFVLASSRRRAMAAATIPGIPVPCLWSYKHYRIKAIELDRRRRRAWTALNTLERIALVAQLQRQNQKIAIARLARSLRRQHRCVLKLALWTWVARVQTVALSLWAANLSPSRLLGSPPSLYHHRDEDVTAHVASIVLRDLSDARAQFHRKCWRVVALAARNHRCWWLRRSFERLRTAVAVHRRTSHPRSRRHRPISDDSPQQLTQSTRLQAAAARAMIDRLSTAMMRVFFREWKAQYVAAALREAEAAHEALLLALHDAALGRQALNPLRAASPTSIDY